MDGIRKRKSTSHSQHTVVAKDISQRNTVSLAWYIRIWKEFRSHGLWGRHTYMRKIIPATLPRSKTWTIVKKILSYRPTIIVGSSGIVVLAVVLISGFNIGTPITEAVGVRKNIPSSYRQPLSVSLDIYALTITPRGGKDVPVEHEGIQYIYKNAYPYTDVVQTEYAHKIKEEMKFSRPGHPHRFEYEFGNIDDYTVVEDTEGNFLFYVKEFYGTPNQDLYHVFTIFAPFVQDKKHRSFEAVHAFIDSNTFVVDIDESWLREAQYPVTLDPTVEINVLNLYSHPQQGDEWVVDFITTGTADLYIIPYDVDTIQDDDFVVLTCNGEKRKPIMQDGDVIFYPNWECSSTDGNGNGLGQVVHYTNTAGKHTLLFTFGESEAFAYNDAGDDWWDTDWNYRKEVIIDNTSNTNTLTDFQVFFEATSTMTDFWGNVASDGADVRFTNQGGDTELEYYELYFNNTDDEAIYWIKVDSIPAESEELIYMYYGNGGASATSSAEEVFSYASREDRFVNMGDYNTSGSYVLAFFDNTSVIVNADSNTEDTDLDTAERFTISGTYLGETGDIIKSDKPIAISGNVASADMWVPFAWQSGDMFGYSYQSNPEIEFYNPNNTDVLVDVYENNSLDTSGITISAGAIDDRVYTGAGTNYRASSTLPVMMYIEGGANRVMPVPSPATEWWGHGRNTRVAAGSAGASFNTYCSNGSTGSGSVSAYSYASDGTCSGTYGTISEYIIADNPISVSAHADGNGSDSQVWFSKKDLDVEYLSPDNYEYVSCATPYASTDITVYTISGGVWVEATSGTATRTGSDPNPYQYKDGTARSGGVKIVGTNPIYCYIDRDVTSDEANIPNRVLNRKGTWPEPEVLGTSTEESAPSNTAPTVSGVTDNPDPVFFSANISFSVDWDDADAGEYIKAKICKTDALTNQNCDGGYWATSSAFTTSDPETPTYTAQEADVGAQNYYAFVCDDDGACSSSSSGSFTVADPGEAPVIVNSATNNNLTIAPRRSAGFDIEWNDTDGHPVKVKVCKTDSLTNQNCDGGFWASSSEYTLNNVHMLYHIDPSDYGQTRSYAIFLCDINDQCSSSATGNFTVQEVDAVPNTSFR